MELTDADRMLCDGGLGQTCDSRVRCLILMLENCVMRRLVIHGREYARSEEQTYDEWPFETAGSDVHPPLHHFQLWWNSEIATRTMTTGNINKNTSYRLHSREIIIGQIRMARIIYQIKLSEFII